MHVLLNRVLLLMVPCLPMMRSKIGYGPEEDGA